MIQNDPHNPPKRVESADSAGARVVEKDQKHHPSWITPAMIQETLCVWQPYYNTPLTEDDAVEMLMTVGRLFDCLQETIHVTDT